MLYPCQTAEAARDLAEAVGEPGPEFAGVETADGVAVATAGPSRTWTECEMKSRNTGGEHLGPGALTNGCLS